MVDFSHYTRPPLSAYVRNLQRGHIIPAEGFRAALEVIDPSILDPEGMDALLQYLAEDLTRRPGRVKACRSGPKLAELIRAIRRADVPELFREALARHLELPCVPVKQRLREMQKRLAERERERREFLIYALYREFYRLAAMTGPWEDDLLGSVPALCDPQRSRSERALQLAARFMTERGLHPPTQLRMMNIYSARNRRNAETGKIS